MTNTKRQRDPVTVYGLYIAVTVGLAASWGIFNDIYFRENARAVCIFITKRYRRYCCASASWHSLFSKISRISMDKILRVGLKAGVIVSLGMTHFSHGSIRPGDER
ncbi:MAG: hypothetical protein U1F20_03945 [Lysobacterales bacterium]